MAVVELAFAGYWFYGASDADERASLYASWGLLDDRPEAAPVTGFAGGTGPHFEGPGGEGPYSEGPDSEFRK